MATNLDSRQPKKQEGIMDEISGVAIAIGIIAVLAILFFSEWFFGRNDGKRGFPRTRGRGK